MKVRPHLHLLEMALLAVSALVLAGCHGKEGPQTVPDGWNDVPWLWIVDGKGEGRYELLYLAPEPWRELPTPTHCKVYIEREAAGYGCDIIDEERTVLNETHPWMLITGLPVDRDYHETFVVAFDGDWNMIATMGPHYHEDW